MGSKSTDAVNVWITPPGENVNFNHSSKDISTLWDLFNEKGVHKDSYLFLMNVDFSLNMDYFESDYKSKVLNFHHIENSNQSVKTNLGTVIKTLEDKKITHYHVSCASNVFSINDSALCIHYYDIASKKSLVVPGLNVIYSLDGIEKLRSKSSHTNTELDCFKKITMEYLEKQSN